MLRTLTLDDCLHVVHRMRPEDRACKVATLGWGVSDEVFAVNRWQSEGPAWALMQGGAPVAVLGLCIAGWSAVAWMVATPDMSGQSWRKLIRHARTVRSNLGQAPFHRLEAHVLSTWPQAMVFAERLGFRYEGTRRGAGANREDIQTWAIVKEAKT